MGKEVPLWGEGWAHHSEVEGSGEVLRRTVIISEEENCESPHVDDTRCLDEPQTFWTLGVF